MNTIFIKKVPDSVLNSKLIKLNFNNISDEEYIIEISIGSKAIKNILNDRVELESFAIKSNIKKISWMNNLITKINVNKIKAEFRKIIKKNYFIGYSVIYSNELKKNKEVKEYLDQIFKKYNINEYLCISSVKDNMYKYIDQYLENNNLKQENIKPIFIVEELENLDMSIVEELNNKYKEVTIFTPYNIRKMFLNKIKKINDEYGSCIQILNKSQKDLRRYNVYIFVDINMMECTKYKFSKNTCFIDFTNKENDKFNEKYLNLEKKIKEGFYYNNIIKQLYCLYGKITVANVIIN